MRNSLFVVSLAIFSMFFGAGNLIYPLITGLTAGKYTWLGMCGFLLTAALLPLLGLVTMILFDGDYEAFFSRLGTTIGKVLIFCSMMIIGPVIAIPRIVTLSQAMIEPFIPLLNHAIIWHNIGFALLFLAITFLASYKENRIIEVLGNIISPILLLCISWIIGKGLFDGIHHTPVPCIEPTLLAVFSSNFIRGYETLDLLGAIFFGSIIINLLKMNNNHESLKDLSKTGFKAGFIGIILLCFVYIGMSILSMLHGHGLYINDAGQLFKEISLRILGVNGTLIIAIAVLMACLSTSIALAAVVGEYMQKTVFQKSVTHGWSVAITLLCCLPLSIFGLDKVLMLTGGPIVYIGYPIIITLTVCNLLLKLYNFKPVKVPVLVTGIIACLLYLQ
ncbi:branched-chain amino acid transport system II carrier protein [bacterium]|nr:MAG: branched-chain amino acid transport system II carrier protein [bacterium]QQR61919.1 MAG: branched-chain amino acid transport system II carrier protein [bacterium]QQR62491.1 MAG: branched-chain amino acid transport system II carrier protein [bacterium]